MRPLRLYLENFGSFRAPTSVDFHDVDYFVLVGPTGAGKSTVIDAICFALYGTVPRWGDEKKVGLALAPSATSGKVALVFEVGDRRYGIVRSLVRNARGTVATREARLDELDPSADPAQDVTALLASPVRTLAEGDHVTAEVERLTGLEYKFFTQCVILPQGRFAEFLHATPSKRQELLVQLLDAGVFDAIRQRAVEEEKKAAAAAQAAEDQLAALTDADEEAEARARRRLEELTELAERVQGSLERLRDLDGRVTAAESELSAADQAVRTLGTVAMPPHVPTLADDLRAATERAGQRAEEAENRRRAEQQAYEELAALGDKTALTLALKAHEDHARLTGQLATARTGHQQAVADVSRAEDRVRQAEARLEEAEAHLQRVRDAHAAADLARRLTVGEPCPVCLHPVAEPPAHPEPAALQQAEDAVQGRKAELEQARRHHRHTQTVADKAEQAVTDLTGRLQALAEQLRAHPDAAELRKKLAAIEEAEHAARRARQEAQQARAAADDAERHRAKIAEEAAAALRKLDAVRDTLVPLGAPPVDRRDLHAAWTALLTWRDQELQRRHRSRREAQERLAAARGERDRERGAVRTLLEEGGLTPPKALEPDAIGRAVATARARAESDLEGVRERRRQAAALAGRAAEHREAAQVAHELALRLRANNFESWLCGEALEVLVSAASQTLKELSDGQFELVLDARNTIEVIDYAEAGMRRNVRTLSGGETFQASLALALALSEQVAGLSAGAARSLESIFLDEGFGTLDPATLDTVAATLERLATAGDRMVGIVTHVPALAERVPVRFAVSRDASGSHLERRSA
ncbi:MULTISPECIES: AAA family ATPase [Thermomonospora]|uniref:Nuclease SbcCD subunit C n=1 Tax=Thermomonospora curvata (strain ATCC 19995 / DSM 43183 / JCM 3096 / KCTC 9072 / NBRC 15933 / NCIMB 10081 / Henssen B9) TaxID=471852 RepID=D1ADM4_THECD|nr:MULTISPECIES: SMC family ATPase [Thermomonospora]ACY97484.1 SMC domain protein [Thermomonospora curvata DSM 43183]PKK14826.1 MAG: SMC family ATPase [Thermomonospora sp. CIF 1]